MKEWEAKVEKVISDTSWTGLQPDGIEKNIADHMMLRFCHEKGDWSLASQSWLSSLLPPGEIIKRQDGYVGFVYKVYDHSFLTWRAVSPDGGASWSEDMEVKKLDWQVCTNLEDWRVLTADIHCPLRVLLDLWI